MSDLLQHADIAKEMGLIITPVEDLRIVRDIRPDDDYDFTLSGKSVPKKRIKQIDQLVIPPAWQDVKIAEDTRAHIQAVGLDAKGRTQYVYHERWQDVRNQVKLLRLLEFGKALPAIRKQVDRDIKLPLRRKRAVLATAIRLIDNQLLRVGNEQYAAQGTRGASTLEGRNTKIADNKVSLEYRGKSGKNLRVSIKDPKLKRRLKRLKKRPGKRLFSYPNGKNGRTPVRSTQINAYLAKAANRAVSAKDFRTFAASAMALESFCKAEPSDEKAATAIVKTVSQRLRNTPAVTRSSYIHPTIISAYEDGQLGSELSDCVVTSGLSSSESMLMQFLNRKLR